MPGNRHAPFGGGPTEKGQRWHLAGGLPDQIHRLKTLKRQMYGRAGFDVLRSRVIHVA